MCIRFMGRKHVLKFIRENKFVDIENIVNCNIDIQNNCLFIKTEFLNANF